MVREGLPSAKRSMHHHSKYPSISMKCNEYNFQMRKVQLQRGFCGVALGTRLAEWEDLSSRVPPELARGTGWRSEKTLLFLSYFPISCPPSCPIVSSHYRKAGLHSAFIPASNSASYLRNVTCPNPFQGHFTCKATCRRGVASGLGWLGLSCMPCSLEKTH